jgi:hypothetical protein
LRIFYDGRYLSIEITIPGIEVEVPLHLGHEPS